MPMTLTSSRWRKALKFFSSTCFLLLLLAACGLGQRSPLRGLHPQAELLLSDATEGAFSPDGQWLVFTRMESGRTWSADLYLLNLANRQLRRLTENPDYDGQAAWSPDSRLLVFTSRQGGLNNLQLLSIADGARSQLTWNGGSQAHFSPDGVSIVYSHVKDGSSDLFLTSPRGSFSRQLTRHPAQDRFPRYSPDGKWIVFSSDRLGSEDLFLLDRKTERLERLTSLPGAEWHSSWSPDSRHLVFSSSAQSSSGRRHRDLFLLEVQKTGQAGQLWPLTRCSGLDCEASWPDFNSAGDRIVLTAMLRPFAPQLAWIPLPDISLSPQETRFVPDASSGEALP